ncbi:MAG: hypothetical protein WBQ72_16025 [Terriglobales bacterium]|jgi:hypothetical protein
MADTVSKSLTRVRDEILVWRGERERLLSGLQRKTQDRRRVVLRMLAQFALDLAEIARRRRNMRRLFPLSPSVKGTAFRQEFSGFGSAAAKGDARLRQERKAATQKHREEYPRPKPEAVEPCRETAPVHTKIERGRRRKGVRHQHRP